MPPGITPAGAGKTEEWKSKYEKEQDHPRRCGENCASVGSAGLEGGITPAGAGKTRVAAVLSAAFQDHPRRCGENKFSA